MCVRALRVLSALSSVILSDSNPSLCVCVFVFVFDLSIQMKRGEMSLMFLFACLFHVRYKQRRCVYGVYESMTCVNVCGSSRGTRSIFFFLSGPFLSGVFGELPWNLWKMYIKKKIQNLYEGI